MLFLLYTTVVIEFMREILRLPRIIERAPPRSDLIKFEKNLKGIKVEPTHRGTGVVRRYKVSSRD